MNRVSRALIVVFVSLVAASAWAQATAQINQGGTPLNVGTGYRV